MAAQEFTLHLARVRRTVVEGEVANVDLQLIRYDQTAQLVGDDDDEFYTVLIPGHVDPWAAS